MEWKYPVKFFDPKMLGSDFIAISNNGQNRKYGKKFNSLIFYEVEAEKKSKRKTHLHNVFT